MFGEGVIYMCMWSTMLYIMDFKAPNTYSAIGYYQIAYIAVMMIANFIFAFTDIDIREFMKYLARKM